MTDSDFLPYFIEEPLYLIKGDEQPVAAEETVQPEAEAATITPPAVATPPTPAAVNTAPAKVEEPTPPVYVKPLPTLGDNLKHCIVLVDSTEEVLEDSLKALLFKIMGSVKRTPEDILLANCRNADKDQIEALLANNNHRHVLTFGTNILTQLNGISPYAIHKEGPKSMLKGDALTEIQENVDKKKALWKALQEMF